MDRPASNDVPGNPYASPTPQSTPTLIGTGGGGDDVVATIIPYRNPPALIAYYLGIFSLIACIPFVGLIGLGMSIAAFVCGINGLRRAAQNPEARGRVHAWIGIICGGIFTIFGLLINVVAIIGLYAGMSR